MNCDELENLIRQLDSSVNGAFNNLNNQLVNLENALKIDINEVKDYVTVDINSTVEGDFECAFPTDNEGNIIPDYAQATTVAKNYSGIGLQGLHEALKIISDNIAAIYIQTCKAIDPIHKLNYADFYKHCLSNPIERADFADDATGQAAYEAAIKADLETQLADSKYGYLLNGIKDNLLLEAPANWINPILSDFSLIQSRINNNILCNLKDSESADVVSIVASDRFVTQISDKVLILHFVSLDNYPKRARNSSYRPTQIPAPKETYDWATDFENLRWEQGNQFAELRFQELYVPVSGWFKDKAAANSYFDAVLTLTTATEDNRIMPEHSNPKTNIPERTTRPYRAFIESVNAQGQAICHVKYTPFNNL